MFGRLKNLFRKRAEVEPEAESPPSSFPPREFQPGYTPGARPAPAPPPHAAPDSMAYPEAVAEEAAPPSIGDSLNLSLKAVLLKLPDSLKASVRPPPPGRCAIPGPPQRIPPQFPQGSVKISFGQPPQAAPRRVFRRAQRPGSG